MWTLLRGDDCICVQLLVLGSCIVLRFSFGCSAEISDEWPMSATTTEPSLVIGTGTYVPGPEHNTDCSDKYSLCILKLMTSVGGGASSNNALEELFYF